MQPFNALRNSCDTNMRCGFLLLTGIGDVLKQFQELFAISTAGPGPGSTKMLFAIAWIRAGFFSALMVFLIWR